SAKSKAGAIGGNGETEGRFILLKRQRGAVQRGPDAIGPVTDVQSCGSWCLHLDDTKGALQRWTDLAIHPQTASPLERLNGSAGMWFQGAVCRTRVMSYPSSASRCWTCATPIASG